MMSLKEKIKFCGILALSFFSYILMLTVLASFTDNATLLVAIPVASFLLIALIDIKLFEMYLGDYIKRFNLEQQENAIE